MKNQIPIIEGKQSQEDISYSWVQQNADINIIEQGIPLIYFDQLQKKRNKDMEYRLVRRITETQYHNKKLIDFKPNLNKMNRYNNIIPYNHTCVKLPVEDGEDEEKGAYINASWVEPLLNSQDSTLIATQGPSCETLSNFWKMIWYNKVLNIIMLCKLKEGEGKNQCDQYWPTLDEPTKMYGSIEVTMTNEETIKQNVIKRSFSIKRIWQGSNEEGNNVEQNHIVHQYQFEAWPDHQVPLESDYDLVEYIVNEMVVGIRNNQKSIVHCSAGIGRTGTLLGIVNAQLSLDYQKNKFIQIVQDKQKNPNNYKYEEEQFKNVYDQQPDFIKKMADDSGKISIFGIVRRLREQRWGMVHTGDQYEYIYKYISKQLQKMTQEALQQEENILNQEEQQQQQQTQNQDTENQQQIVQE